MGLLIVDSSLLIFTFKYYLNFSGEPLYQYSRVRELIENNVRKGVWNMEMCEVFGQATVRVSLSWFSTNASSMSSKGKFS